MGTWYTYKQTQEGMRLVGGKMDIHGHEHEGTVLCKSLNPTCSSVIGRESDISSRLVLRFIFIPQTTMSFS